MIGNQILIKPNNEINILIQSICIKSTIIRLQPETKFETISSGKKSTNLRRCFTTTKYQVLNLETVSFQKRKGHICSKKFPKSNHYNRDPHDQEFCVRTKDLPMQSSPYWSTESCLVCKEFAMSCAIQTPLHLKIHNGPFLAAKFYWCDYTFIRIEWDKTILDKLGNV